jgi:kinesin family protein 6/9
VNNSVEDFAFRFSRVFEPNAKQEDVFDGVARECVMSALDGYNSTVFAYGQTGSGKTFSITGGTATYNDRGLIPRALSLIYDEVARRSECQWTISISYLQIYNDKGQDLLNRGVDARTLEELPAVTVHETDDEVVLKGLEARPSASVNDALNLLFLGDTNRLYCETPMNKTSSRSHCIFTISLEARQHGTAIVRRSKLNLVDLAGSERVGRTGVTGTVLTEAKYINLSLHYLEHVIHSLSEQARGKREHVPYRNSFMTMVLRDSLGGNCRTTMLATAHPGLDQLWETLSTCRFAQRVASIKQDAHVNEEQDPTVLIRQLKQEVAQLKEQVAFLSGGKDADPGRQLSNDELSRCRDLVQRFLSADAATAAMGLVGAGSDMARIQACFKILRDMALGKGATTVPAPPSAAGAAATAGRVGGGATPPPSDGVPVGGSSLDRAAAAALQDEVRRLRASLQMKENEMSLLFDVVQRHQLQDTSAPLGAASGGAAAAAATQQQQQQPGASVGSFGAAAPQPPRPTEVPMTQQQRDAANAVAAATLSNGADYDLAALSDPALLQDRATAFEAFRRSFRKYEQIAGAHTELQERYKTAKGIAGEVNTLIETMKAAKFKVQQLRAARALQTAPSSGGGADEATAEEQQLLHQLQHEMKPKWQEKTSALAKEKERIEHMQLLMRRTQEQLIRDFEAWFGARQDQLKKAGATVAPLDASATTSAVQQAFAPRPPAAAPSSTGGAFLPSIAQPQPTAAYHYPAPSSAPAAAAARLPAVGPGAGGGAAALAVRGDFSIAPSYSAPGSAIGPRSSLGGVVGGGSASGGTGLVPPSTGNPAADAELARLYQARAAMRASLGAGGGASGPTN